MQELAKTLNGARYALTGRNREWHLPEAEELDRAAQEWAKASVSTFRGALLERAFAISVAITSFLDELEPGHDCVEALVEAGVLEGMKLFTAHLSDNYPTVIRERLLNEEPKADDD